MLKLHICICLAHALGLCRVAPRQSHAARLEHRPRRRRGFPNFTLRQSVIGASARKRPFDARLCLTLAPQQHRAVSTYSDFGACLPPAKAAPNRSVALGSNACHDKHPPRRSMGFAVGSQHGEVLEACTMEGPGNELSVALRTI
jgi:hypothetical protein